MAPHFTALGLGFVVGAVVAFLMKGSGANVRGITGRFASPFQQRIDTGGRR